MGIERLETLAKTPRPLDPSLEKIRGRPFFFLRGANRAWEKDVTTSPLCLVFVVQANEVLFEPGEGEMAPAVVLFTRDERYCRDVAWLTDLGERIYALKSSGTNDPKANELGAYLAAEESEFDLPVPVSLTGGVAARVKTTYLSTDRMPNKHIGSDRMFPALVFEDGDIAIIPSDLYA
jgi:hypothetical protein